MVEVASNFAVLPDPPKWLLSLAMIMGRLEIFTLLVLFTRLFGGDEGGWATYGHR